MLVHKFIDYNYVIKKENIHNIVKNCKRANKFTFTKLFYFPTSGKGVIMNFDGVGAGWHQTVCHCIAMFGMKGFGSDIGQIVWYLVGTG